MKFSVGAVGQYTPTCAGPNLPLVVPEGNVFCTYYLWAGHDLVTYWKNGDVWGDDFRDNGGDADANGGSELPDVYFYTGHGSCQNPPGANSPDFITVCGNFGTPNTVNIRTQSGWGNSSNRLAFLFLDASCPMDLVSLTTNWFPPFKGLHVATGHSGTANADTLDSWVRGADFAARTVGLPNPWTWFFGGQQSVGDAWMASGTIAIQSGCSAVVIAAGATEAEAIDRRDNERITDGRSDPTANWLAWRWRTR